MSSERTITTGTKTPETRSARRCTSALPFCASSTRRAIWASWVSAPTRVARTTSRPPAFTQAPVDLAAGPDLDRHRLPGQHRGVHGGGAGLDDPVGGDLLAGPDHEGVAHGQLLGRDRRLDAVAQHADLLGAQRQQRAQRGAGAALGPVLEPAPGQQERRDAGGGLEVDVVQPVGALHASTGTGGSCPACRRCPRTARPATSRTPPARPTETRVSIVVAPCRRFVQAARWNGQAPHTTTGAASVSAAHCQLVNCQAGTIESSTTGSAEQRGDHEPLAQRVGGDGRRLARLRAVPRGRAAPAARRRTRRRRRSPAARPTPTAAGWLTRAFSVA